MKILTFTHPQFGAIRGVEIDGEAWLVGEDVAATLGYAHPENAIAAYVDIEDKIITLIQGRGFNSKTTVAVINESGLYSLAFSSKLPGVKTFKRWITKEVIPSIRAKENMTSEELTAAALLVAQKIIKKRQARLRALKQRRVDSGLLSLSSFFCRSRAAHLSAGAQICFYYERQRRRWQGYRLRVGGSLLADANRFFYHADFRIGA